MHPKTLWQKYLWSIDFSVSEKDVHEFIEEHVDLIETEQFDKLYELIGSNVVLGREVTRILEKIGIDVRDKLSALESRAAMRGVFDSAKKNYSWNTSAAHVQYTYEVEKDLSDKWKWIDAWEV